MASNSIEMTSEQIEVFNNFKSITENEDIAWKLAWKTPAELVKIYSNLISALLISDSDFSVQIREICRQRLESIFPNKLFSESFCNTVTSNSEDKCKPGPSQKRGRNMFSSESEFNSEKTLKKPSKRALIETSKEANSSQNLSDSEASSQRISNKSQTSKTDNVSSNTDNVIKTLSVTSHFDFRHYIGKGAYGIVNAYEERFSSKLYAIKAIKIKQGTNKDDIVEQYKREYYILSQLDSKGLFTECYNVFIDTQQNVSRFCIQMPVYEMTIDQLVIKLRDGPESHQYSDWFISVLMQEVFDAVEIMHENSLIHRDLKAANILVSFLGTHNIVKVGDFGFARQLYARQLPDESTSNTSNKSYTLSNANIGGTPLYRAPNVAADRRYRKKDDIYSLGILYAELISTFQRDLFSADLETMVETIRNNSFPSTSECFQSERMKALVQLIKDMTRTKLRNRLPIREVKKINSLIIFIFANYSSEDFASLETKNLFENFFSDLIGIKPNDALVEHYSRIHNRTLFAVLDDLKSLNHIIEKKYLNSIKTNACLKQCRMKKSLQSKLFNSINKINIFSSMFSFDADSEETEIGFIFTIGHNLEDVYERDFSDEAALLNFSDLQIVVSTTGFSDPTFETMISNANELLLEKWHKVVLLDLRWTCFEPLLRKLEKTKSNEPLLPQIINDLLLTNNFLDLFISADSVLLPELMDYILIDFKLKHGVLHQNDNLYRYCEVLNKIAEAFDIGSRSEEKTNDFCKKFFPKTHKEKQNFTQIYFFAEALIFQLESFFAKCNKYWIIEHFSKSTFHQPIVKVLSQLILKNEKRREITKKITNALIESIDLAELTQAREIIKVYNQLSNDEVTDEGLESLDPSKRHLKFKKSFSFFTKLSICLCDNESLTNLLKCLCLIEMIKGYEFFQNVNCDHLLLNLFLTADKGPKNRIIDLPEINFDDIIFEIILKVISK